MTKNILSKNEFVKILNGWKNVYDYYSKFNHVIEQYCDGYVFPPDCSVELLHTLEAMFSDNNGWIEYFVFDLDFGAKYQDGMIKNADGSVVRLAIIEDLYDLLIKNSIHVGVENI